MKETPLCPAWRYKIRPLGQHQHQHCHNFRSTQRRQNSCVYISTLTGSIIAMGDYTHILIFSSLVLLSDCKLLSCETRLVSLLFHLWWHSPIINYTAVGPDSHCNNLPSESTFTLDKFTLYYFITSWFIAFLPSLRQAFFVFSTLAQRLASHWINWPPEASLGETYFDRWD